MKLTSVGICCLLLSSIIIFTGCSPVQEPIGDILDVGETKSLKIVTTFPPLYAHVANIIDDNDSITNLVPPGTSVHTRQPRPSDVLAMESADLIITNGLGLEEFLEGYLDSLKKKGVLIVDTSTGVETIEFDEYEGEEHNDEDDEHAHDGPDPHIWLDPQNVAIQVGNILTSMNELDPLQETVYTDKANLYIDKLTEIDLSIRDEKSKQAISPFIVFHDAYQYFLHAYDLESKQIGLIQEFHGDSPSQKQIAELIDVIVSNSVKTIYTEVQFNPSVVKNLEKETVVESKEIDPIGDELSKEGYTKMLLKLSDAFSNEQF